MLSGLLPSSQTFLFGHYRSATTTFNGMLHPSVELQQLGSTYANLHSAAP
ncbi:hypothetical protein T4B_12116 [Trichinella pseudospiralis]|uniref:Uncharacterized protein n=1 Tax=Trichinella pseudospiralis TaxID=6337 RepID=A0A0V1GH96_TRIPS|nr:hypothetical protein T4B_12116 [Trichinella pseudospiralis]